MPLTLRREASLAPAASMPGAQPAGDRRSTLERMPKWLICVPIVVQWLWLSLRYRSATLPSAANPRITSGGMVGEGKLEYFRGMGEVALLATARHASVQTDQPSHAGMLERVLSSAGLAFPVIAKPDLGLCGYGVRRIDDMGALQAYVDAFPRNETIVLQEYLPQDGEAGVFYARDPVTQQGRVIGLALRFFPSVVGDGERTLRALVAADPRARRLQSSPRHECAFDADTVPRRGAVVRLATVGSTRIGGLYRDGGACITPALVAAFDAIARDMPDFHFGRFDVRYSHLGDLCEGTGFKIMEINGAGSEAIEAWDPDIPLVAGLRRIFAKQRLAFEIGDARRREGARPTPLFELARLNRRQIRLLRQYPPSN